MGHGGRPTGPAFLTFPETGSPEKGFLFSCTAFCGCEVQDGLHLDVGYCGSSAQMTEIRRASAFFPRIVENSVIPTGFGASRITIGTNSAR